jgi:hypothetical protein
LIDSNGLMVNGNWWFFYRFVFRCK